MSTNRVTAPAAELVCRVASTKCPVREACTAICAVSKSRISPIMMTSGSCRKMARKARAKVISIFGLTCVWPTPSRSYSIGSSTVIMLRVRASRRESAAYSVVVLPEPVGPVTNMMPCGCEIRSSNRTSVPAAMPRPSSESRPACLSRRRITTRSPCPVGSVDTRTSTGRPAIRSMMRPSCGKRFSAISSSAITLTRETIAACSERFGSTTSRNVPSTRNRTSDRRSKISR